MPRALSDNVTFVVIQGHEAIVCLLVKERLVPRFKVMVAWMDNVWAFQLESDDRAVRLPRWKETLRNMESTSSRTLPLV